MDNQQPSFTFNVINDIIINVEKVQRLIVGFKWNRNGEHPNIGWRYSLCLLRKGKK